MRIEVKLDEPAVRQTLARLRGREDRTQHLRPAFEAVATDFLNLERRRFAGAARWAPLSPEYARRKAAGGRPILPLAGGALERSLTRKRAKYSVRRINRLSMFVGTRDPVANLHRKGTRRMPARPPVDITAADRTRWKRIFVGHLAGAGMRLGL
jgi:hypothetical protein